jgi:RNA recognition motif-containing protein
VRMVTDRETGRACGFAFVEMAGAAQADPAVSEMNGGSLDGRPLTFNEVNPIGNLLTLKQRLAKLTPTHGHLSVKSK